MVWMTSESYYTYLDLSSRSVLYIRMLLMSCGHVVALGVLLGRNAAAHQPGNGHLRRAPTHHWAPVSERAMRGIFLCLVRNCLSLSLSLSF